ncbi:MAG: type I DNA topoisomerase [Gemmataceae bacterium]
MPSRKKQAMEEGTPRTVGRKKTASTAKPRKTTDGTTRRVSKAPVAAPANGSKRKQDLVIVESPAKAKTINKYLGANFKVLASYGHVRDLPRRKKPGEKVAGIDIEGGWVPTYVVVDRADSNGKGSSRRRTAKEILAELKREAAKSNHIYLATDPDREGEAIAWHIEDALGLDDDPRVFRITFNEITRSAVQGALAHPGKIDMDRVHAQEARRILDRVVGFPLSGLLSKKVARRSSAGRVQSVALRLVVDREREIEAFVSSEFWKITALLAPTGTVSMDPKPLSVVLAKSKSASADEPEALATAADPSLALPARRSSSLAPPPGSFLAELAEWDGKKFESATEETATAIACLLEGAAYTVAKLEQKDRSEKPQAPFTTSTLQQQSFLRLRFSGDRTMKTAQRLYEGVDLGSEGSVALITYMRTDSTRVSADALQAVRAHIDGKYGSAYLPDKPHAYASGKSAQEAHEAIRPTDLSYTPERVAQLGLQGDQLKLYTLIYQRFVASQMAAAVFAVTNVEVQAIPTPSEPRPFGCGGLFKAQGKVLKFDGYRKVLPPAGKQEDATLPSLSEKQKLDRLDLTASQHFTQPPPRYNEASLVKALEKEGIGRPSTYATIIHKITSLERAYIEVKDRRFYATKIGKDVTDLLIEHFPKVMDLKFTSRLEEELDQIETKQTRYNEVLNEFWGPFSAALKTAEDKMPALRGGVETGEMCPKCGKSLLRNYSKKTHRYFTGCSGFKDDPPCKYIKPEEGEEARPQPVETEYKCPTCGKTMLERMGKTGPFLGCSGYPECKTTMNFGPDGKPVLSAVPTEHTCEKCGQPMVIRQGKRGPFLACTGYPKCKNAKDVDANGNPVQPIDTGVVCEKCGSPMTVKKGFRGPFLGCSNYPKCRSTKPLPPEMKDKLKDLLPAPPAKKTMPEVKIDETCPECGGPMKLRQARKGYFLGCAKYPKCKGTREASPELLEQLQETGAAP